MLALWVEVSLFLHCVWLAISQGGVNERMCRKSVWLHHILLQRSLDLLDDLDKAAAHLIHMDTPTSPSIPYLSKDQVICLGLD